MTDLTGFKYIGCRNGWPGNYTDGNGNIVPQKEAKCWTSIEPKELIECKNLGHTRDGVSTRNGYHKTWCVTCKIWWDMDSGD